MFLLYAFVGVLCLGLAPVFGKTAVESVSPVLAFVIRTVIAALLGILWLLCMDHEGSINDLPVSFWAIITTEALLAAFLGDLAYFHALQNGNISEVSLVMACAPLITLICGHFFYNEAITMTHILGAALITSGLVVLIID